LAIAGGIVTGGAVQADTLRAQLPDWVPLAEIRAESDQPGSTCRYIAADLGPGAPARPQSRFAARPGTVFGARWRATPANRTTLGQMAATVCVDAWDPELRARFWRALGSDGAFVAIDPASRDAPVQSLGLYAPNVGLIAWITYSAP
jgi:hypothetical protein